MRSCSSTYFIFLSVSFGLLTGADNSVDMRCRYNERRTMNCTYNVSGQIDRNYTCSFSLLNKKDSCINVTNWTTTAEVGRCDYQCNPNGFCHSFKRFAVQITSIEGNFTSCKTGFFTDYLKPGLVRNLRVYNVTSTSLKIRWKKPKDYDITSNVYNYTIQLRTENFEKNYTIESNTKRKVKYTVLLDETWRRCNTSVTAVFKEGGFSSDPVITRVSNPDAVVQVLEELSPQAIAGIVLGISIPLIVVIYCVYKRMKICCANITINVPKLVESSTISDTQSDAAIIPQLPRPRIKKRVLHDSGRGSMETNTSDIISRDTICIEDNKDLKHDDPTQLLLDTESEIEYSGKSQDDCLWADSGESCLSVYRQVAADVVVNIQKDIEPGTTATFSNLAYQSSNPSAISVKESVDSYASMSLHTGKDSVCAKEIISHSELGVDEDESVWEDSGGSFLSTYRQVATAGGNSMERSFGPSASAESDLKSLISGFLKHTNNPCSLQEIPTSTQTLQPATLDLSLHGAKNDLNQSPYDTDDTWDDLEGSALSAYRQVPLTDDSVALLEFNDNDDNSSINLSHHSCNTSSSSLSQSAPESVTSYSAVSATSPTMNGDSHS